MADLRESFPPLEVLATGAGVPIHLGVEGETVTAKNASPGLVAKDASGNFKYLLVDASGNLVVNTEGADTLCKKGYGNISGNASLTLVAEITLTASKVYQNIGWMVSSFRDTVFKIEQLDDATVTVLGVGRVGPGAFTSASDLHCLSFTTGATGTQKIRIRALNLNALSDIDAAITAEEVI